MRSILLFLATVALAAFGVAKAFEGWPRLLAYAVQTPAPAWAPPPASQPTPLRVVSVDRAHFREVQQQPSAAHGAVVLDLERLESLEAAQTLAQSWADALPAGSALVCWLAASDVSEAAAAAPALARAGCTELRVVA